MDGWMDGWMDAWMDGSNGWMDGRMDRWTDGRAYGWIDGRMDGRMDRWADGQMEGVRIPARQASSEVTAAVDVELSKRCFQATRTVKFAKMAKKFPPDSAKAPGLRVTPLRMPKLQRAKNKRFRAHFRIRTLFLQTDF